MKNTRKTITVDLGNIGHKAERLQAMFIGQTKEPNDFGYFLRFENTTMVCNYGTQVVTNIYETEEEVHEMVYNRMLFNL